MRVVLDTNVLVSGIAKWPDQTSSPAQLLHQWDVGAFELGVSDWILRELDFALSKPYFEMRVDSRVAQQMFQLIKSGATRIELSHRAEAIASHWQDDLILAAAVEFRADYLVTGDRELLDLDHPFPFRIVHPNEFAGLL